MKLGERLCVLGCALIGATMFAALPALAQAQKLAPNFKSIIEYERSVKEYPNIKVGEDFKGYRK
jgi:hypothetical protein